MIETPEINNEVQLSEIRDLLHILIREVQELKQQKLPASPEKIEALLAALFVIFLTIQNLRQHGFWKRV